MPENLNPNQFEIPADLTSLSPEELQQAVDTARSEYEEIRDVPAGELTDAQADRIVALADFTDAVRAEEVRRDTEASARAERVEAAAQRMEGGNDDGDEAEGDDEVETEEPTETEGDLVEGDEDLAPEAVAAAGARRGGIRTMRPKATKLPAKRETSSRFSMVAAADVSGVQAGAVLPDLAAVAKAFIARSKSFPSGQAREKNVRHQHSVAQIERLPIDGMTTDNPDFSTDYSLLQHAASERRLSGGSLLASGGWCAPSDTMYGLTNDATTDGLIDLPEITVAHGGINFTPGIDFSALFTNAGFAQTEAEAIAGTTKNCVEVDCPDFSEVRLDAVGVCVKAPILTKAGYPELVTDWISGTVTANAHKVAARLIASMRTSLGTALAPVLTGTPVTWSTLTAMELVIEGQRQAFRLSDSEALEVIVPRWVRVALRSDLANRNGIGKESVSNADIAQHFADRGAAVQFVLNYLELSAPKTVIAFPTTFEIMVYPAGTFVKGNASVLSLDTVYDTASLLTNVYTAAFVEDGVLIAKMKFGGARITLPCNVNGMLGAPQLDDNWGAAQVENAGAAAA